MHFADGLVALTNRRIARLADGKSSSSPGRSPAPSSNGQADDWQSFPLADDLQLRLSEQSGVGKLELLNATSRLACWRYTPAASAAARRFEVRWTALRSAPPPATSGHCRRIPTVCPSCGEVITSLDGVCPACALVAPPQPVSSLLRLLVFAKSRAGMMVLGLLLTIAGNFVGLMPAYLTGPLIDNVLVPWQEGQPILGHSAYFYLALMIGAALVAWQLNWARLFVTSWVSEYIAADLRGRTYEHLQSLSLEFFGGKRTGDLMSRIDNDSDRICVFLSVTLVDFINDLVMVAITAVLLLYKDARLAICTLAAISDHLLAGLRRQTKAAPRIQPIGCGHRSNFQRAGRHHSRHPRRQSLFPGKPRSRPLPARQSPPVGGEQPLECDLVVLRTAGFAAHGPWNRVRVGVRRVACITALRRARQPC